MHKSLRLLVLLLFPCTAFAQSIGSLSGQVQDGRTGEPLPGVNVIFKDMNRGAATDIDGNYTVPGIPAGTYTVVARFIGYKDNEQVVTISAGQETIQNFSLAEDLLQLDEVVVTGQAASVEKRTLAANVDVLNIRDIEDAPVVSVDQLLQGRVSGSTVRLQSAQPGQGTLINFRGITSVFSDQTPVIYIDGVRVDNNTGTSFSLGGETTSALSELLTSDIERIEVTKGGAASTLYGSDAANGVIQIFTKRGVAGSPVVTLRTEQGVDFPVSRFLLDTGFAFPSTTTDPDHPDFGKTNFIRDDFLKDGYYQNYYAGVSGGSTNLTYNISARLQNGTGVQPSNENTIYAVRGNVQASVSDKLSASFSAAYTRSNFDRLNNGTAIADPITTFEVGDAYFFSGADNFDEALRLFLLPQITEGVNRFTFATTARYNPSPLFSSSLTAGIDNRSNEQRILNPSEFDIISGDDSGSLSRFDRNFMAITLEYVGTVSYPREGNVTSNFSFGAQGFRDETSIITGNGETFALPGTEEFDEAGTIDASEARSQVFNGGIFFKEQVGLWDRLFINAGIRFDGNSAFGDDVGLQSYPSLGVAYTISDESFWLNSVGRVLNEMKLRVAYGQTGKFPSPFAKDVTFQATSFREESAPRFNNPGNEDLKPEKTSTIEAGFETSLLDGRLGINFTYYQATTTDALFSVPEQPSTGKGTQLRNIGEIENKGIELSLNAHVVSTRNVDVSIGANYSWFENEVIDMGGAADFNVGGSSVRAQQRVSEGHPIGEWRPTVPIDSNGDGKLDDFEFQFIDETPFPTQTGSINTSITLFRKLSIFALADWQLGSLVFDWGSHWASFNGLERAERPVRHDLDGNPVLDRDGNPRKFSTSQSGISLLQDGDFLKLREVSIRYALPRQFTDRLGLLSASVFVQGRNLVTLSRQDLVDPELAGLTSGGGLQLGGEQSITLSPPRQFRLGLEVQFK
ncbi:MAG: SusC/RagA family TonB-linked outer membrane protein [Rhodothermales bacterium]